MENNTYCIYYLSKWIVWLSLQLSSKLESWMLRAAGAPVLEQVVRWSEGSVVWFLLLHVEVSVGKILNWRCLSGCLNNWAHKYWGVVLTSRSAPCTVWMGECGKCCKAFWLVGCCAVRRIDSEYLKQVDTNCCSVYKVFTRKSLITEYLSYSLNVMMI